jgi:DNA-directed RNA polymerase specialized sigma24 family protein
MSSDDLGRQLAKHIPYLRRYARALTGSQGTGDRYALATMEAMIADPDSVDAKSAKIDLFRTFHAIWSSSGHPVAGGEEELSGSERKAQSRLSALLPNTREALLLNAIEGFTHGEIGTIMGISAEEAATLVNRAFEDMSEAVAGEIMVIEDEAIIAMDLEGIVRAMGHVVTGVARTRDAAIALAARKVPDLILADIQLADGSSGIDAVNAILAKHGDRPVIFITAFPERLLTGERPEPAFLISKPYGEEQVRAAVSQAMFFASTEGLVTSL